MKELLKKPNIAYSGLQVFYWAGAAVIMGFSTVYLRSLALSNSAIGIMLAASNIAGFLLTTRISCLVDQHSNRFTLFCFFAALVSQLICLVVMLLFPVAVSASIAFLLCIVLHHGVNTLLVKLYVDVAQAWCSVNFGFARGLGSASYGIVSTAAAPLIAVAALRCVPVLTGIAIILEFIPVLYFLHSLYNEPAHTTRSDTPGQGQTFIMFLKSTPGFALFVGGATIAFAAPGALNSFMINVVENAGGGVTELGYIFTIKALVEIPIMLLFSRLCNRVRAQSLLAFSIGMICIRLVLIAAVHTLPGLYCAAIVHAVSTGIYTPASVIYFKEYVPHSDAGKAQGLVLNVRLLGSVLATILSGFLLDRIAVGSVLILLMLLTMFGTVVSLFGIHKMTSVNV